MPSFRPHHSIETLTEAAEKVAAIPAHLPNCLLLQDSVNRARGWLQEAEELQVTMEMEAHALYMYIHFQIQIRKCTYMLLRFLMAANMYISL